MNPPISRIALYVRDMEKVAAFYERHFGFTRTDTGLTDKFLLTPPSGGCALVLLQASKGHKTGQSNVKLIFDVGDVAMFKADSAKSGLKFGAIHKGSGYEFANARDPAGNPIQISSGYRMDGKPSASPGA
ncbi:VOC family protein [Luteolibacter ambystomatis]|uniref:VOC family protein n=1 Tax=Luteolibacter ambystomatis TaxID=2824561 RepID=A0A975G6H5_9BACT|nr:VOC family protein [Luteolibacter ambystomatis]QUE49661.1 VOC family protein [Luteolibacter ambystomatis]